MTPTRSLMLRLALVLLLLSGQHVALTHAIWHASGDDSSAQQTAGSTGSGHAPERGLCVFDAALGQILGGAHATTGHFAAPEAAPERIAPPARASAAALPLSFHSRAPPVLL